MVQLVITDEHAKLAAAAADVTLRAAAEGEFISLEDDEKTGLENLAVFMAAVAETPSRFPVTGHMAQVKGKPMKAPLSSNRSVRNRRKARQEQRTSFRKRARAERRETVAAFNAERERLEELSKEQQAAAEIRRAEIEKEPKYNLLDIAGNVLLRDVPKSMIVPVAEGEEKLSPEIESALEQLRADASA